MREYEYFLTLLVTAAVTYLLTPVVRRLAIRIGAIPATRDRDVHAEPIPRMGGLAMYFGVAAGLLTATEIVPFRHVIAGSGLVKGLLLAGGLIVVIGIVDDRWGISAIGKLAGQVAAAGVLVASGVQISSIPLPKSGVFTFTQNESIAVTIMVVVATINAVNFIDGLDGLAAGIVCLAGISFFIYYYSLTKVAGLKLALPAEAGPALAAVVLAGACIGFLPHNFYPARIFMGDTGSMLLGLLLAYVPISAVSQLDFTNLAHTANRYPQILPLLLPAAVMVIPYTDTLRAVIRRMRAGQSPFAADNKHLHHRMLEIGHSHRSSVLILYAWAALFAATVVGLSIVTAPLAVLAGTTLAAVLVLGLLSIPRLRWWQRRPAPVPAERTRPAPSAGLADFRPPHHAPANGSTTAHHLAESNAAPPSRPEPGPAYVDHSSPARVDPDRPGLDRPGLDRPGLDRPGLDRPGLDRPGLDRLGPGRAYPDRPEPGPAYPDRPGPAGAHPDQSDATAPMPVTRRASGSIIP